VHFKKYIASSLAHHLKTNVIDQVHQINNYVTKKFSGGYNCRRHILNLTVAAFHFFVVCISTKYINIHNKSSPTFLLIRERLEYSLCECYS
jgi:hypothetical protein